VTDNSRNATKDQADLPSARPEVENQPDEAGPDATTKTDEKNGPPQPQRFRSRDRGGIQSKEQNERIANRPSRPASTGRYASPRSSMYDSTGIWDAWEASNSTKADRRIIIDPPSHGSAHTTRQPPASARSRPPSMQKAEDLHPWMGLGPSRQGDYRPPPPPMERLHQSPTKRQPLVIDADGRPRPIRTTSESRQSRSSGDASSRPTVISRRGKSADGRFSKPVETPAKVVSGSSRARPQSMGDIPSRPPHHSDPSPGPTATGKLPAESWGERETADGAGRQKTAMWTVHEDPDEEEEDMAWGSYKPRAQRKKGDSSKSQDSLDPEKGVSRSKSSIYSCKVLDNA
jgi:hypothetical protein